MNTNPVNLTVRFLLELAMLSIFAYWGWHLAGSWERYVAGPGLPIVAATLWGIFRIQNDPKPAPVEVSGIVRLLLEFILFGVAVYFLYDLNYIRLSWIMAITVIVHYLFSYDRTWAMLLNKPYKGFVKD